VKVGDLVTHSRNTWENTRGIVLEFWTMSDYTKVYWFSHERYNHHPVEDLEVISESR